LASESLAVVAVPRVNRTQDVSDRKGLLMTLEEEFHAECVRAVDELRSLKYVPTAWIHMMNGPGGAAAAARRLLVSGDIQSGFERLIRMGRADLTVEYAVLQPRWRDIFEDQHRQAARWRLQQAGATGA
jgi:hypothetical protein